MTAVLLGALVAALSVAPTARPTRECVTETASPTMAMVVQGFGGGGNHVDLPVEARGADRSRIARSRERAKSEERCD